MNGIEAGVLLRFYTNEGRKHGHIALHEWLLEKARAMGIQGGSAFRAIAGYGRHGTLHEEHFFELAADLPIEVDFVVSDRQADALLEVLRGEQVRVFYARIPAQFGMIGGPP